MTEPQALLTEINEINFPLLYEPSLPSKQRTADIKLAKQRLKLIKKALREEQAIIKKRWDGRNKQQAAMETLELSPYKLVDMYVDKVETDLIELETAVGLEKSLPDAPSGNVVLLGGVEYGEWVIVPPNQVTPWRIRKLRQKIEEKLQNEVDACGASLNLWLSIRDRKPPPFWAAVFLGVVCILVAPLFGYLLFQYTSTLSKIRKEDIWLAVFLLGVPGFGLWAAIQAFRKRGEYREKHKEAEAEVIRFNKENRKFLERQALFKSYSALKGEVALKKAVEAMKGDDKAGVTILTDNLLSDADTNSDALYLASFVLEHPQERIDALEALVRVAPSYERGVTRLKKLQGIAR